MTLKYNRFGYLIGEGFSNVFKNKKSTGASLMIMCATMLIFGVFLILGENINHVVAGVELSQGFQVYINEETPNEEVKQIGEKIKQIEGVSTVEYVSPEDALNQMKEKFKDKSDLLSGIESDIFPPAYVVTLTDLSLNEQVQQQINKFENIKKIESRDDLLETLLKIANGIKIVTLVILVLLITISVFIISNTIKLTVHARRKEISIMKYVGATNNFIRWPFIVEGMIIGIIASIISITIVGLAYTWLAQSLVNLEVMQKINVSLVTFSQMLTTIVSVYLILGIGIGAFGSIISMRKYLKV